MSLRSLASSVRRYTVRAGVLELPSNSGNSLMEYIWAGINKNNGSGTAVHCPNSGRKIGYERLRQASENFAGWLGENCNGSLALLLPDSPETVVTALAALEAGVPLAAMNPESTADELAVSLQKVRSPWIVTKSSLVHTALEAVKAVEVATRQEYPIKVITIDDEVIFSDVVHLVDLLDKRATPRILRRSGAALVSQAWRDHGPETVLASEESLLAGCIQAASPHLKPGARLATNIPFFTRYGLSQGVLNCLASGAELLILPKKGDLESHFHRYNPTVASVVPSSLEGVRSPPPASLKAVTVHGLLSKEISSKMPAALAERMIQHYGPPEGPVVFSEPSVRDCTRLGQPVAGTEVKVTAGGGEVGVMSEGEISVKGPQFGHSDSWISTGDSGYYDPEGTFYLTKSGGMSVDGLAVWPAELETVLQKHEGVVAAAVFAAGPSLVAAVVPSDPYNPPLASDIKLWLTSRLAPHKKLGEILFTSALPITDDGHIDRALLSSRYIPPDPKEYAAVGAV